jgi:hypothetical protein
MFRARSLASMTFPDGTSAIITPAGSFSKTSERRPSRRPSSRLRASSVWMCEDSLSATVILILPRRVVHIGWTPGVPHFAPDTPAACLLHWESGRLKFSRFGPAGRSWRDWQMPLCNVQKRDKYISPLYPQAYVPMTSPSCVHTAGRLSTRSLMSGQEGVG